MNKPFACPGFARTRVLAGTLIALSALTFALQGAAAQEAGRCRISGSEADVLLGIGKRLAADPDSAYSIRRQRYHIPATDSSNVSLVTTDSVCALAGNAYNANLDSVYQVMNRSVYVVRVGSVYIVSDPAFVENGGHGYIPTMVLDANFVLLATFAS
jgi:hypothetical protein